VLVEQLRGVGSVAVQIAKTSGAEVTGVGSSVKSAAVPAMGADHVIDYTGCTASNARAFARRRTTVALPS